MTTSITNLQIDEARRNRSALLIADLQPDFLPGGALAVEGGDAIFPMVRHLLEADPFGVVVATQDWHPPGHISFASSHPGRKPCSRSKKAVSCNSSGSISKR